MHSPQTLSSPERRRATALRPTERRAERGSSLGLVLVLGAVALAVALVSLDTTHTSLRQQTASWWKARADQVARAGLQRGASLLRRAQQNASLADPMASIDALDRGSIPLTAFLAGTAPATLVHDEILARPDGTPVGVYTVTAQVVRDGASRRRVRLLAVAWSPNRATVERGGGWRSVWEMELLSERVRSQVFDYSYFLNNWGWWYMSNLESWGPVRANAQFDFGGYSPTVHGDITATLNIANPQNVQGEGADPANQHEFVPSLPMPNLTDLTPYEQLAASHAGGAGSSVTVAGSGTSIGPVWGDDPGETPDLYLWGTDANPIVLDGPVVVRGNVILGGRITGQGAIYALGNVYVPKGLEYQNPPDLTPTTYPTTQTELQAWLTANETKDAVGLFARENVVLGNYRASSWQSYVNSWRSNSLNASEEDAGLDQIQHSGDAGEGNGVFDTAVYTETDAALGLIPPERSVGDTIPGTGEDLDGDGQYDPTTQMAEFDLSDPTISAARYGPFAPNLDWDDLAHGDQGEWADSGHERFDGAYYTNHAIGGLFGDGAPISFRGSIVSRNEYLIVNTSKLNLFHDPRLSDDQSAFSMYLPTVWAPLQIRYEKRWDATSTGLLLAPSQP